MMKKLKLVDITKYIFAICILILHVGILNRFKCGYYIINILFRTGVPFFFIILGYFFRKNIKNDDFGTTLKRYLNKLLVTYLIFAIIYVLLAWYIQCDMSIKYLLQELNRLISGNPSNIMWFSGSLIWSLCILSLLKDKKKIYLSLLLAIILYLVGLSFTTYSYYFSNHFPNYVLNMKNFFGSNRSFWFVGYIFTAIGFIIGTSDNSKNDSITNKILFVVSLILLIIEISIIKEHIGVEHDYFIMHLLYAPLFNLLVVKSKFNYKINIDTDLFRKMSTTLYNTHFIYIYAYMFIIKLNNNFINMQFNYIIILVSIFTSFVVNIYHKKRKGGI